MTNTERIQANNAELRESIAMAASLPNAGGGIFIEDTEYPGCFYREVDGEKEWLNPPMVVDMAYPTVERYMGKRVWVGLLNFGYVKDLPTGMGISFSNLTSPEFANEEDTFYINCRIFHAFPYYCDGWNYHPFLPPIDVEWGKGLISDEGSHAQINFFGVESEAFGWMEFRCLFKFTNDLDEEVTE